MDPYLQARRAHRSANGQLDFLNSQTTATVVTVKSSDHTIYIQRARVFIETDSAQSVTLRDSNATPEVVFSVAASPGTNFYKEWDFGPSGKRLTEGKDLVLAFSAAGLAGHVEWEGFQRQN